MYFVCNASVTTFFLGRQKMCYVHTAVNAQMHFDLTNPTMLDLAMFNDIQNIRPDGAFTSHTLEVCDGACQVTTTENPSSTFAIFQKIYCFVSP